MLIIFLPSYTSHRNTCFRYVCPKKKGELTLSSSKCKTIAGWEYFHRHAIDNGFGNGCDLLLLQSPEDPRLSLPTTDEGSPASTDSSDVAAVTPTGTGSDVDDATDSEGYIPYDTNTSSAPNNTSTASTVENQDPASGPTDRDSCKDRCGRWYDLVMCRCDEVCKLLGDCCRDYSHQCSNSYGEVTTATTQTLRSIASQESSVTTSKPSTTSTTLKSSAATAPISYVYGNATAWPVTPHPNHFSFLLF